MLSVREVVVEMVVFVSESGVEGFVRDIEEF